jgi:Phosphate-selective porin O and P
MNKPLTMVVLSLMLFPSLRAVAQMPPSAAPPGSANPSAEAPAIPEGALPAAPDAAGPQETMPLVVPELAAPAPASPTVEEKLVEVEGQVDGLKESLAETQSTVGSLSKLKVSGYIQARFEEHADSLNGVNSAGKGANTNRFFVRRGRLKTTYGGANAEYMLQIDATGDGVVLKDAEATFVDTWSPLGLRLTVGQFKWPFGYEILQSSGEREMPERSLVIRKLFPGERDRGLRVQGKYEWLRFSAGLVNGNGTQDAIYAGTDQNTFKDLVGRVGGDFEWLVVGLSGYWGRALTTTLPSTKSTIAGADKNMDGAITPDELSIVSTAVPASYKRFSRARLGADAQIYADVPMLGGLAVKGEFVLAKDSNLDYGAVVADPCLDATSLGWIVTLVQNIGDYVGAVVRIDYFDPVRSKGLADTCIDSKTMMKRGLGDATTTVGGGLLLHGSGNIKATMTYEHIAEQSTTVKNDIFTAQLQAKF